MTGMDIEADVFDESQLPDYLRFRVEVQDENGQQVAVARSLDTLQAQFGQQAQRQFMDRLGTDQQRDDERDWVFGSLPTSMLSEDDSGQSTEAWPAVIDQGEAKQHGLSAKSMLAWSTAGSSETLIDGLVVSSLALVAGDRPAAVRDEEAFSKLLQSVRAELGPEFRKQSGYLDKSLKLWSELSGQLDDEYFHLRPRVFNDMRSQLDDMIYEGFLHELSPARLQHYPRYLEAMQIRLGRDYDQAMDDYRWLMEEFRVSLFAQQLGTRTKVSVQRLKKALQVVT
jgi:ATP-dependent helicase HrpA